MTLQATPRDELYTLLADYEKEGACSCPESALLRWCVGRLLADYPGDEAIVREAWRRLAFIDSGRRARTPALPFIRLLS